MNTAKRPSFASWLEQHPQGEVAKLLDCDDEHEAAEPCTPTEDPQLMTATNWLENEVQS